MARLPLVSHASPDGVIAWGAEGAITVREFLADARRLAGLFPAGSHVFNMCGDRYCFSVGLAAAIMTERISLLPSTYTPETVRNIRSFAPDVFCLTDSDRCAIDLPQVRYPAAGDIEKDSLENPFDVPKVGANQLIAVVFTSGSTGTPQPHPKTWGALVSSVTAEAGRLGLSDAAQWTLIGTVPAQHMYGFESTVLIAWQSGNAYSHTHPFYPADISRALAGVPAPRMLVSSPVHLRALLDAGSALPDVAGVVSATAPLSVQLAREIEAYCNAPLTEIYGSTETGQIASRRSTQTAEWRLFPGVRLMVEGDCARAYGGHIEFPTVMSDMLEPVTEELFLLQGRKADLVNIAGKRHSLASLNHTLNSIPGVVDGAFFMPDETDDRVTRLAACVVAPGMKASELLSALRERIDPVFLPRPLLIVEVLPRNRTGKLPREALQALLYPDGKKRTA